MPEASKERIGEGLERISYQCYKDLFLISLKVLNYSLLLGTHCLHFAELQKGRCRVCALIVENQVRD